MLLLYLVLWGELISKVTNVNLVRLEKVSRLERGYTKTRMWMPPERVDTSAIAHVTSSNICYP